MVSKYFSYSEVTRSNTAKRLNLNNCPNSIQLERIKDMLENIADPIREWLGGPLKAESIFRSDIVNKNTRGASKISQHRAIRGAAGDFDDDHMCNERMHVLATKPTYKDMRNRDIFFFVAENLEFDQLIWEFGDGDSPAWNHISYVKGNNRKKITIAYTSKGKAVYEHFKTVDEFIARKAEIYELHKLQ